MGSAGHHPARPSVKMWLSGPALGEIGEVGC